MGNYTTNLSLYNTDMNTDGNDTFDFQRDLNDNNNIIDSAIGKLSTLTTTDKASLVSAINEIVTSLGGKASKDLDNLSTTGQAILDGKVEVEALLQQNGYAKFSWKENNQISNLIVQWGFVNAENPTPCIKTVNLPISYTNNTYSFIATPLDLNTNTTCSVSVWNPTSGSIQILTNFIGNSASAIINEIALPINWFAVGF